MIISHYISLKGIKNKYGIILFSHKKNKDIINVYYNIIINKLFKKYYIIK